MLVTGSRSINKASFPSCSPALSHNSFYVTDVIQEINMCATQYRNNLCATNPIPAMVQQCANWDSCMNRDPTVVGRAKVGAELIAEVINGFVEPISWKTLVKKPLDLASHGLSFAMTDIYIDFTGLLDGFHQHPAFPVSIKAPAYLRSSTQSTPAISYPTRHTFPSEHGLPLIRSCA